MSGNISPSEALAAIRRGEEVPLETIRLLGERQPGDFFRIIVESLADSFDPAQAAAYERVMRAWIPEFAAATPAVPERVDAVYVLSRVTLGADIKITSIILDAMRKRFPEARIVLVANKKSAELFAVDHGIKYLNADYPRSGPVSERIDFAHHLRRELNQQHSIVIDPDSRMTQLGLIPLCSPERYFHFRSRTAVNGANLTDLTQTWLEQTFSVAGESWIAPEPVSVEGDHPGVAISFGVGENESKLIPGEFEARVIGLLAQKFATIWIDRGVGGAEARRVTEAVALSGAHKRVRFWEGSFAGFASILSQCDLYVGYDSAGQHAAAASGVPLVTFFKGAANDRFRQRWSPSGRGQINVINADSLTPDECLAQLARAI